MTEWLRWQIANLLLFQRVRSNRITVDRFTLLLALRLMGKRSSLSMVENWIENGLSRPEICIQRFNFSSHSDFML
jgi:hypothetical protein